METYFVNAGFPGVGAIGRHGESVGTWSLVDLSKTRELPADGDTYIFGAFHPGYLEIMEQLPGYVEKGFLFSSSVGEIDLEPDEQQFLRTILNHGETGFVWFGNPSMGTIFGKGFYAPYPVSLDLLEQRSSDAEPRNLRGDPAVTLLNPSTEKKNALNQAAALKHLEEEYGYEPVLHTVMDRYSETLDVFGVEYEVHDWLEGDDYWAVLKGSDLNMCVSWAETFSYQTLEAAYVDTPVLVSPTVDWVPIRNMCWKPNDPGLIAQRANTVVEKEQTVSRECLENVAEKRNREIREKMGENIEGET